jgi:O-antigen/teichoic acid export membrane protein
MNGPTIFAAAGASGASGPIARVRSAIGTLRAALAGLLIGGDDRARTQRDALAAFGLRVASAALLYLTQIVMARWIGSHDYGIYVFVWTWVLVLGGIAHLGLNAAMMRLLPEYREHGDMERFRGLVRGGRLFALAAGTVLAAAGMAGLYAFEAHVTHAYVLPAYLALICVPLFALTEVQDGIGRGQAWIWIGLLPPYVLRPLFVLASMMGASAAGLPMSAATAAGAAIVGTWVAAVVQAAMLNRKLDAMVERGARTYDFTVWMKVSLPLVVVAAAELMLQNTDILVVSRYMTPTDVAIYFAAAKTMSLIMFVHYAVGSAVANRFSALNARGDTELLRAFVRDSVNWTFWPSLLAAALILALGKPLLWLFGPQFEAGYPVMFVLVVGFLFRSSFGPAEVLLSMLGEHQICAAVLIVAALLNVALNFALVPTFGLLGAAIATSISLATAALMNYVVARRRLEIEIAIWRNLPKRQSA